MAMYKAIESSIIDDQMEIRLTASEECEEKYVTFNQEDFCELACFDKEQVAQIIDLLVKYYLKM